MNNHQNRPDSDAADPANIGLRSVCAMRLRHLDAGVAPDGGYELQPGDVIVGRTTGNWLSAMIAELDGYFTHATIYVGDGTVAHAYSSGVSTMAVDELGSHYPDGMAVASPDRSVEQRAMAVAWAMDLATPAPDRPSPQYSGKDLGMAWALLQQVKAIAARRLPTAVPDGPGFAPAGSGDELEPVERFESTCSGFVFRAYSEGANAPLEIVPAPGVLLEDGLLRPADEDDPLWDELANEPVPADADAVAQPSALRRPDWKLWRNRARMMKEALAGWLEAQDEFDKGIPLAQGVTPGDLWCSPDIKERVFHTTHARDVANKVTEHCG